MPGELSYDDFKALLDKGLSPQQIASLEKDPGTGAKVPAYSPDWRAHVLAMLPAAGATVGGILGGTAGTAAGGIGAVPGAMVGAGLGASGGRIAENLGRTALGIPRNEGLIEKLYEGGGGRVPEAIGGLLDVGEQGLLGGATEGVPAKLFGVPGRAPGAISRAAGRVKRGSQIRAARKDVRRQRAISGSRSSSAELESEAARAAKNRASAGAAKGEEIRAATRPENDVSVFHVADRVADNLKGSLGIKQDRRRLAATIRGRIREVVRQTNLGAKTPKKSVFSVAEADEIKQAFSKMSKPQAAFNASKRGVQLKPELDTAIHRALRELIEDRAPNVAEKNREFGRAAREHGRVLKRVEREKSPIERGIATREGRRKAVALARTGGEEGPSFGASLGIHGVRPHVGGLGRLAGGTERFFARPDVSMTGRIAPGVLNALVRAMLEQNLEPPPGLSPEELEP